MERFFSQRNIERYRQLLDISTERAGAPADIQVVGSAGAYSTNGC
jgi:hypothetical protein